MEAHELTPPLTAPRPDFLDEHGNPLRFNYHQLEHQGEHLPTVKQAIPAVWLSPDADRFTYQELLRWIDHRKKSGLEVFLLASIRCLSALVKSRQYGRNRNGDNMGIVVEAAFDEIRRWPRDDPGYTDETDFIAEPSFLEPCRPSKYNYWLTYYYIRWIKRAARRAIKVEVRQRRRLTEPPEDLDRLLYLGKTRKRNGTRHILTKFDSHDPLQLAIEREIELEIENCLQEEQGDTGKSSWLSSWLDENIDDPVERAIVRVRAMSSWRTQTQIIEVVNSELGTAYKHDKVRKCLQLAEKHLAPKFEIRFGFRPTERRKRTRASGVAPGEIFISDEYNDNSPAMVRAAAQYELDEDGYKIGPKILPHPRPLDQQPYSQSKSA